MGRKQPPKIVPKKKGTPPSTALVVRDKMEVQRVEVVEVSKPRSSELDWMVGLFVAGVVTLTAAAWLVR